MFVEARYFFNYMDFSLTLAGSILIEILQSRTHGAFALPKQSFPVRNEDFLFHCGCASPFTFAGLLSVENDHVNSRGYSIGCNDAFSVVAVCFWQKRKTPATNYVYGMDAGNKLGIIHGDRLNRTTSMSCMDVTAIP